MSIILHRTASEGFVCEWRQEADGRVHAVADGDVDADGANGQHGHIAAYRADNAGSEALGNGGMKRESSGRIVWAASWGPDIALHNNLGLPLVLDSGIIPSKTAWHDPALPESDPASYADSETVPYLVVPDLVRRRAGGVVLGCRGRITDQRTGRSVEAGVLDIGPRTKSGEFSIAAARALGIESSPRSGGIEKSVLLYEFWPGSPFVHDGFTFALIRA